jgi:C4-dicarboxylate transporter DctM subunit
LPGFIFSDRPFWLFLGQVIRAPSSSFVLVAVTFFLLMGEILLRSGLSEQLYRALNVWLRRWPGGLLHTNIAACAIFSAISGSSVATAATMGSVALPYFEKTAYNQRIPPFFRYPRRRYRRLSRSAYRGMFVTVGVEIRYSR